MYKKDYSIGLDIGATSVGFAAIDDEYKVIRLKGKNVIGARLFQEGQTAAERRNFRTTRRRLSRRKWRLSLLEEIFDPYMAKIDPTFFARLKESNLSPKDKNKRFNGSLLFPTLTDSQFYSEYPTIYHLRDQLMKENKRFDLREIFLAIHHIVKYRGNFLNNAPASTFSTKKINFRESFEVINDAYAQLDPINGLELDINLVDEVSKILLDNKLSNLDKQKGLAKILAVKTGEKEQRKANNDIVKQISKAVLGYKFDLAAILKINSEDKKWHIRLNDENIDEILAELMSGLNDNQLDIINTLSKLYSRIVLNDIVPNGMTLSEAMVQKYNDHKKHLAMLKQFAKSLPNDEHKQLMKAYAEYIGNLKNGKKISQEEFYKNVKRHLDDSQTGQQIAQLISKGEFMPKQRTNQNGVIPYQLHLKELDCILEKQSKYYPWLAELNPNEKRRNRAKYKISELVAFRVPYYVGPMITKEDQAKSSSASFAWMVRKAAGAITPWNFDEKVDRIESANQFIKRMTTKDTYLIGEDVLPDHSLLYERFKTLNELNMVRVNGHKLSVGQKQDIFNGLFKKQKSVRKEQVVNQLMTESIPNKPNLTGLSNPVKFNSSLGTYNDFAKIFKSEIDNPNRQHDFEKIIEWITIFEDKNILKEKLNELSWLTTEQISSLLTKRYSGWGKLSRKLLTGLTDENGQSIIERMWNTQQTFMEIVSEPVFAEQIKNANQDQLHNEDYEDILDNAYTSPQNKKAIRQVIKVVDDIAKAAGRAPKFISLEFARDDQKSRRSQSRLARLRQIYETTAKELVANDKVRDELKNITDLNDRLYLYFTQRGRDMYTGDPINIDEISTHYDIDHIFPRAFVKDDSLNNKVLVSRAVNNGKSNNVPLKLFGAKMKPFWKELRDHQLISKQKYDHLMTNPDLIDKYKANGFISRQLVETRQVIKLAANILADRYSNKNTQIIEVKASLNHQLREALNLYKNREVNDYHHAVDGYLSAFVGQYLYNRYPSLQSYFVYGKYQRFFDKQVKQNLKFNRFNFLYDLTDSDQEKIVNKKTGELIGNKSELIKQIKKVYRYKYMLITQEVFTKSGALFDQTLYSPDSNKKRLVPIKQGKPTQIYGGYSGSQDAYMVLIRIPTKKEDKYKVVGVPVQAVSKLSQLEQKGEKNAYLEVLNDVIKERTAKTTKKIKKYLAFQIVVPKLMYRQLIIDGDLKYTLGSSTYQYNARQLVLSEKSMKILNTDFAKSADSLEEQNNELMYVYDDILDKVNKYMPLYDKNKFRTLLNNEARSKFETLPILTDAKGKHPGKVEMLSEILKGLHDNPAMGNTKCLGIKTAFGKLQTPGGIPVSRNAVFVYQSPTGLFERQVRLKDLIG
ncbi:MAG: type II CRISPR RNA-guided endonuclease Cas9 [Limosilactobacillus sp.]